MYYLIHEKESFIILKTRGAAELLDMIKYDFSSQLDLRIGEVIFKIGSVRTEKFKVKVHSN